MTEFIITCDSELKPDGSHDVKRFRELVRCKDCKYGYHLLDTKNGVIIKYRIACFKHPELMQSPDWFCADGERRSE